MKNVDIQIIKNGSKTTFQIRHKDRNRWGEWQDIPVIDVTKKKDK